MSKNKCSKGITACAAIVACALVLASHAAEETTKQRIFGLFSPDRQDDLRELVKTLPDLQVVSVDFDTAEATFKYDVAKLIPNHDPKKPPTPEAIAKRINDLLSNTSHNCFSLNLTAATPKDKLKSEEIPIGILDCKGCRYGAYLAVAKVEGVDHATVLPGKSFVTIWIDPAKTNRAALEATLKKAGVEMPVAATPDVKK